MIEFDYGIRDCEPSFLICEIADDIGFEGRRTAFAVEEGKAALALWCSPNQRWDAGPSQRAARGNGVGCWL